MATKIPNWLSAVRTAYPSAASPYWRGLPVGRMKALLVGTFFTGTVAGFAADLLEINAQPLWHGVFWPLVLGMATLGIFLARIKKPGFILPGILFMILVFCAAAWVELHSRQILVAESLSRRIVWDAAGILIAGSLASRLLISYITAQGLERIRMQTELSLAHGIQAALVPTIAISPERFEIFGKSIPSAEMGGDLIDVVARGENLLVYIADISGHGLAAGQLMGMLKAAIRVAVQSQCEPGTLLEIADRVLPSLKDPSMYATMALLSFPAETKTPDGASAVAYAIAGHPPILHFRAATRDTSRLWMEQFPLGLIADGQYAQQETTFSAGDIFLMLSDGILEVADKNDEEFGLSAVEHILRENASEPLSSIWKMVMDQVNNHGPQQDDQTLLMVRAKAPVNCRR